MVTKNRNVTLFFPVDQVPKAIQQRGTAHVSIYRHVADVLKDELGIDQDEIEIASSSSLVNDFGCESVDLLSIALSLEESYGHKFPQNEFVPLEVLDQSGGLVHEGRVTDEGLEEMQRRAPFLDLSHFSQDRSPINFGSYLTVLDVCRWVAHKTGVDWPVELSKA